MKRTAAPWLASLSLRERALVFIASCQSRYETSIVSHLRQWWPERAVRLELRDLTRLALIELDALDRIRWRVTVAGMNAARAARDRAQKAKAA